MESFGARVRELRTLAGLSQEALAAAAKINKETVYRIERGQDTRATTIGKLRIVLPGLDRNDAARRDERKDDAGMSIELDSMAARIGHLVQGFHTEERLHRVRLFVIQQLKEEADETQSPRYLNEMSRRQENAERQMVAGGSKRKKTRNVDGSGRKQH